MTDQPLAVTISWDIKPPTGITLPQTPSTGSLSFPLLPIEPSASSSSSPDPTPIVNNPLASPHYTSLLHSLSLAKDTLNAQLTSWKDAIGDKEKSKEVVPAEARGKMGMGKAAMMNKAAREADGREGDVRLGGGKGDGLGAGGGAGKGSGNGKVVGEGGMIGLPTDDQSSDEEDEEGEIPAE